MSGGTFLSMNKVRPGAYMNFKSVARPMMTIGDRGIASIPITLDWGAEDTLIDVYSDELLNGDSLPKVGFDAFDENSKILNLMLQYCYLVKVYRTNTEGGANATTEIGTSNKMTVTAKYKGVFGNKITISVVANGSLFDVSTFVNGSEKDLQTIATIEELEANKYVTFSGTGAPELNAGKPLAGGKNGTATKSTYYPKYLKLLETARFQTMGNPELGDEDSTLKANVATFIENQRDKEGRYVQGVLAKYPAANQEGIISVKNGVIVNGVTFTKEEMSAVVASMTAGAAVNESNTNKSIEGATDVTEKFTNTEIIDALKGGELVFTTNQRGEVKIEQDINSYHTFIPSKNYSFSKNRIIRTMDEIGASVKDIWEQSFMGKVDNDANGREIFKSNLNDYFIQLQNIGAIQNYKGVEDIEISQGADLDVVIVGVFVQPVDSMEKLYMTVNVIG